MSSYLKIKKADIGYNKVLFSDINLTAEKKEIIAVIGLNGIGKSTFLKSLSGIINFLRGEVFVNGENILKFNRAKRAGIIGFSSIININVQNLLVQDLVALGRIPHTSFIGNLTSKDKKIISEAIKKTGLSEVKNKLVTQISDGQKQRAFIARLIAQQTKILLFDEPTAFLDIEGKYQIISLFKHIAKNSDKIVIFSTHDLKIAIQNADKIWLFDNQKIIDNSPEDLILNGKLQSFFSNSSFIFNNFTADFDVNNQNIIPIKITNQTLNKNRINWTKKGLKRIDCYIDDNANIEIIVKDNFWILKTKNNNEKYFSFYKMIKNIRYD